MADTPTIFICSTQIDLSDERKAVVDAIARLKLRHESMEYFGAYPEQPIDVCLAQVRKSDLLIVIVGHLYGSLIPGKKVSFTQAEYDEAYSLRKPCLVYFRHHEARIPSTHYEKNPRKFKLLDRFKATLKDRHTIATFGDWHELALQVSADVSRFVNEHDRGTNRHAEINILNKGRCYWNKMRQDNLREKPELTGYDLKGIDLSDYDLSYANLSGADLSNANLRNTNLFRANLQNADFRGVKLGQTFLIDVDLSQTAGLGSCEHLDASVIDHSTLNRSGRLPPVFLRGCGISDRLIEYLPSLFEEPIQYYSCFISYSSKDHAFAERLRADLQNAGVRCWLAPTDLPLGAKTWDAINAAIRVRDKVLLILSNNAVASDWVEHEVAVAFGEERRRGQLVLFPVRIDDAVMETAEPWAAKLRDQRNIGDFRNWKDHDAYQQAFGRVLRDLKAAPG